MKISTHQLYEFGGGAVTTQRVTGDKWRFFKDSFGTLNSRFLGLWCVLNGISPSSEGPLNIDAICCCTYAVTDPPLSSRFPAGREGRLQRARGEAASKKPEKTPQSGSSELQSLRDDGRMPGSPDSGRGGGSSTTTQKEGPLPLPPSA